MMGIYPILGQKYGLQTVNSACLLVATLASFVTLGGEVWALQVAHWLRRRGQALASQRHASTPHSMGYQKLKTRRHALRAGFGGDAGCQSGPAFLLRTQNSRLGAGFGLGLFAAG